MIRAAPIVALALLLGGAPACAQEPATAGSAAAAPADAVLFIANKRGDTVSRIALGSGEETNRADSCANPHELALSPDGRHVALACYGGSSIELFRTADMARIGSIELGANARPHGLIWHDSGRLISTAQGRGSAFIVRDPLSGTPRLTEIAVGEDGPHLIALSADGATGWGTVVESGEVVRIDLNAGEVTTRRVLGGDTEAVALSPDGSALWVGTNTADTLYRLNPETLETETEIATGGQPIRVAVHPDGRWAVTSNLRDGTLSVIDTATNAVARTIAVSGEGEAAQVTLAFSPGGDRLYLAETGRDTVAEIDFESGAVMRRLPAGEGGDGLAVTG